MTSLIKPSERELLLASAIVLVGLFAFSVGAYAAYTTVRDYSYAQDAKRDMQKETQQALAGHAK